MPVNNFTVGRDVSLVINTPNGQLTIPGITDFTADPMTTELKSKPLSGIPQFGYVPDGWKISLKLDRMNRTIDNFWAAFEAAYYAGSNQVAGTINETISELDGSVSQWRYTGVVLKLEKAGDFSGDKKVEQSLTGLASQKIQVS
jgi:hypothetical protein